MVVEDDTDGEALVTFCFVQFSSVTFNSVQFSYIQFNSVTFSSIQLYSVPFSSIQFNQLTTQLEAVKLSELMEGTHIPCGR